MVSDFNRNPEGRPEHFDKNLQGMYEREMWSWLEFVWSNRYDDKYRVSQTQGFDPAEPTRYGGEKCQVGSTLPNRSSYAQGNKGNNWTDAKASTLIPFNNWLLYKDWKETWVKLRNAQIKEEVDNEGVFYAYYDGETPSHRVDGFWTVLDDIKEKRIFVQYHEAIPEMQRFLDYMDSVLGNPAYRNAINPHDKEDL